VASVRELCRILGVDRDWFYRAGGGEPAAADTGLRAAIEALVLAFPGYGYRRVMRAEALQCQIERCSVPTTDAAQGLAASPSSRRGLAVTGLDQVWVADMTYVRLPTTVASLAAVLDAFSRRVVGWALDLGDHFELDVRRPRGCGHVLLARLRRGSRCGCLLCGKGRAARPRTLGKMDPEVQTHGPQDYPEGSAFGSGETGDLAAV
jgi:transposase InsO family protein